MAITCPKCGAGYDVTLFQFEHRVQCHCGAWVELASGHLLQHPCPSAKGAPIEKQPVGKVTRYSDNDRVASIEIINGSLAVGNRIHINGPTSDFIQTIESMHCDHVPVQTANAGQTIDIRVIDHVREQDAVNKVAD